MAIKNISRIFSINRILIRHGLDEFLAVTPLSRYAFWLKLLAFTPTSERHKPRGQRIREALIELGPIFVKFGQMLSTRRDLLPDDIANELMLLQDKVTPFDETEARERIEQQLGKPVSELFSRFTATP
ncbi:MAG: ubiquinone biosynthesis regulatory protein kinase UbiB, partial [Kangiellaceae bacterium]|nr:ubiquinone biosynthesis regulatory protein kinase UbiB [Kangiellaceae bacterium]